MTVSYKVTDETRLHPPLEQIVCKQHTAAVCGGTKDPDIHQLQDVYGPARSSFGDNSRITTFDICSSKQDRQTQCPGYSVGTVRIDKATGAPAHGLKQSIGRSRKCGKPSV